jgi:hypothetical protein
MFKIKILLRIVINILVIRVVYSILDEVDNVPPKEELGQLGDKKELKCDYSSEYKNGLVWKKMIGKKVTS